MLLTLPEREEEEGVLLLRLTEPPALTGGEREKERERERERERKRERGGREREREREREINGCRIKAEVEGGTVGEKRRV